MSAGANPYQLSPEEHESIYAEIKARYLGKASAQDHPVAIITGGQPGSGKSGITNAARRELSQTGGFILIDADKIRIRHPRYDEAMQANDREAANLTHPDAGAWAARLNGDAIDGRRNVIIDQTSKDPEAMAALTEKLREAGYRTELRVMAVNERVSEQRINSRYESQKAHEGIGRYSTKANHDIAYAGVARTVAAAEDGQWVDAIRVYDKDHRELHGATLEAGRWKPQPGAAAAILRERERPMRPEETKEIVDQYKLLTEQIADPRRNATPAEKQAIAGLLEKAVEHDRANIPMGDVQRTKHQFSSLLSGRLAYKQALAPTAPAWTADQERRATALEGMKGTAAGALLSFAEVGTAAIQRAGSAARVDWVAVEREAATQSLKDHGQPVDDVVQAILQTSPNAVTEQQRDAVRQRIETLAKSVVAHRDPGPQSAPSLKS